MDFTEIVTILKRKDFSIKDTGLTYRTVNNWSEKRLLSHLRETEGRWHKLTFLELVEIYIYKELKAVGFSLKKMRKVKSFLHSYRKKKEPLEKIIIKGEVVLDRTVFSIIVISLLVLSEGKKMYLVISSDVKNIFFLDNLELTGLVAGNGYLTDKIQISGSSFVIINIRKILQKIGVELENEKWSTLLEEISKDNEDEKEREIKIFKTGNKIEKIRMVKNRKIQRGESMGKLVKKPNQKTTFFSNNNGSLAVRIEEEI